MRRASISRFITGGVVATLIGMALAWLPVFAQQPQGPALFDASPVQQASCLDFGAAETARHGSGAMRFIGTRSGNPLAHPQLLDARTPPETAARSYLSVCGSMFGLSGDAAELALQRVTPAENQRSVVRFQGNRGNGGIPVFGGELIVQLDSNREPRGDDRQCPATIDVVHAACGHDGTGRSYGARHCRTRARCLSAGTRGRNTAALDIQRVAGRSRSGSSASGVAHGGEVDGSPAHSRTGPR